LAESTPAAAAIEFTDLNLVVRHLPGAATTSISTVRPGLITSLIGPSGCGKSTLCAASTASTSASATSRTDRRRARPRPGHLRPGHVCSSQLRKQSAWCSSAPTRCPCRSTTTSCSATGCTLEGSLRRKSEELVEASLTPVNCSGTTSRTASTSGHRAAVPGAAAEALHRSAPAAQAGGAADGRALLRARRRGHRRRRGADLGSAQGPTTRS
jgi:hypothetical protein